MNFVMRSSRNGRFACARVEPFCVVGFTKTRVTLVREYSQNFSISVLVKARSIVNFSVQGSRYPPAPTARMAVLRHRFLSGVADGIGEGVGFASRSARSFKRISRLYFGTR